MFCVQPPGLNMPCVLCSPHQKIQNKPVWRIDQLLLLQFFEKELQYTHTHTPIRQICLTFLSTVETVPLQWTRVHGGWFEFPLQTRCGRSSILRRIVFARLPGCRIPTC